MNHGADIYRCCCGEELSSSAARGKTDPSDFYINKTLSPGPWIPHAWTGWCIFKRQKRHILVCCPNYKWDGLPVTISQAVEMILFALGKHNILKLLTLQPTLRFVARRENTESCEGMVCCRYLLHRSVVATWAYGPVPAFHNKGMYVPSQTHIWELAFLKIKTTFPH